MERYYQPEIECASREQIRAWQDERLVKQVRHAYDHVPYYKKLMDEKGVRPEDIKSVDDLHKLPFTYKKDLRDTYPYGLFAVPMKDVVRLHASSGTTGKQIVVGYTREDLDIWDDIVARQLVAVGATEEDKVHISYGYGLFTGGMGLHGGATKLGATVIPVSSGNTQRQITILRDFGSTVLCCTPSYAAFIGETLHEMGLTGKDIPLKAGIFGAEAWSEEMRQDIQKTMGIKAYDIYGLTELSGPGVAFECSAQSGMHINEDHFIAEIIDPDTGEVLPEGSKGELVFTSIDKEAFPLLRYRTRDICILKREKCSCGRTLVKMCKPMGRSDDMLIIRGVNVFPSQIESALLEMGGTTPHYLMIVDRVNNLDTLEVHVEVEERFFSDEIRALENLTKQIEYTLQQAIGLAAKVKLVEPKGLERSMGKSVHVIDKRKLD